MGWSPRPSRAQEKMAASIRYQIPLCGIWGMAMSPGWADPGGQVSSPSCVYLLASCGENLPINCVLILPVYDSIVSVVLHRRRTMKLALQLITTTSFPFGSSRPLYFFGHICCHALRPSIPPCMHTYGLFWHVMALNRAPVTKTLPAVLGIHLLFHTRADL